MGSNSLPRAPLHPDVADVQNFMPESAPLDTKEGLTGLRDILAFKLEDVLIGYEDKVSYEDIDIPGPAGPMRATIFRPKPGFTASSVAETPGVVNFHMGGHISGNRFMGIKTTLEWIEKLGAVCLTAEYRLTPEHPQPAQLDDSYAALTWMSEHAAELGFNPHKLIVTGGSAGGNLAAGVALLARDQSGPEILGQLLIYPWVDDSNETVSIHQFGHIKPWTRDFSVVACNYALGENRERASIYTVPSRAKDLNGLPSAFVDVGSADVFRDESIEYANALMKCGVQTELHVWPGCWHAFDVFVPDAPIARRAARARLEWLHDLLSRN
ncbi:hypothetical protein N8T08_008089 [Aspergillus melleus]|uniref:Uncharacterized protein n=1 Tax=Aspergillus melleus TaxID=138277 RepID=A0ACC3AWG3_9EURO|nr:hypothetical protein N8T08_008089 [Aspergillus melleus]